MNQFVFCLYHPGALRTQWFRHSIPGLSVFFTSEGKSMPWLQCVFKTQVSHVSHVSLWLFTIVSEILHLFVIWFVSGQHSLIIPTFQKKKQHKLNKIAQDSPNKAVSSWKVLISIFWCGRHMILPILSFYPGFLLV